MRLILALILLATVSGCIEHRCIKGERYYRDWKGDNLWHKSLGAEPCYNLPEQPE